MLLGNGNGTFQAARNFATGFNPRSVAVGDFNGDGQPDLAVGNMSSNSVSVLLNAGTTTVVTSSVNPSVFGQSVTFTATVSSAGTPTGTVTFLDGSTSIGTGVVSSGLATFITSSLTVAMHTITAVYSGDSNFALSTSLALSQTVNKASTTVSLAGPSATPTVTVISSTDPHMATANGGSDSSSSGQHVFSADGRYVVFESAASNLVNGDTNGCEDVFVKDVQTGAITRVSTDSNGNQGNSYSEYPSISSDGCYVAFMSYASNLVSGDTNCTADIFVKDVQTGAITRVSTDSDGNQGNAVSMHSSISRDGRYVAFDSNASNLVSGDTNGTWDVFVKEVQTGTITQVSTDSDGNQGNSYSWSPSISGNGRYVAFYSTASNLVSGDTNGADDVFVKDVQTGATTRVSTDSDGNQGNSWSDDPSISSDGRYVAFESYASNLVSDGINRQADVFVKDVQTGAITRVSTDSIGNQGNSYSEYPSISSDGRYVTFESHASNLVSGDTNGATDVFVKDVQTGAITRVSTDSAGNQGNSDSYWPSISSDGRYVAFMSNASNLVSSDSNGEPDVFLWTRGYRPVFGQGVTLTATCSGQWSVVSGQWPTGTVTFQDGTMSLGTGTLNGSGTATLTTTNLGRQPYDDRRLCRRQQLCGQYINDVQSDHQSGEHDHNRDVAGQPVGVRPVHDVHGHMQWSVVSGQWPVADGDGHFPGWHHVAGNRHAQRQRHGHLFRPVVDNQRGRHAHDHRWLQWRRELRWQQLHELLADGQQSEHDGDIDVVA